MPRILIILCILSLTLSGCSVPFFNREDPVKTPAFTEPADSPFDYTEPISVKDVKTALIAAGLQFTETSEFTPDDYIVNDLRPTIYSIKPGQHVLMLYEFGSIALRNEAGWTAGSGNIISNQFPLKDKWLAQAYTAKNVLIINMLNYEKLVTAEGIPQVSADIQKASVALNQAVLALNEGQTLVFADKSNNWDARLTVKYYQHWYEDSTDTSHIEQVSKGDWRVKYLGDEPESIKSISYEYTTFSGSGSGNGDSLQKIGQDYYLRLGSSGNIGIPGEDSVYTLSIKWNDQQESLDLKAVK